MKLVLTNIKGIIQASNDAPEIKKGKQMSELAVLKDSYLVIEDGLIESMGPMSSFICPEQTEVMDVQGCYVFPLWIDSHTHIVYAGSREKEFVMKIKGASYEEIFNNGGGILNSVALLRKTPEEQLLKNALGRLEEMISMGTGAVEIKSGYGLDTDSELKILRVIRSMKELSPIPLKATFLGAHAIPLEYRKDRNAYIKLILDEMIPRVADEKLADYIDVFCEKGFFTVQESELIINKGIQYGLKARLHANEMDFSGGVQLGVKMDALSVDHLECTGDNEIEALKSSSTIPTLLPSTAFFLNLEYAPARKMIDSGLGVALASDYNPGTSPSGNMNFVVSLACIKMKMLPEEAVNAATINSAATLELNDKYGAIVPGYQANFFITKPLPSWHFLPYSFGNTLIDKVYVRGAEFKGIEHS
jgi:imidazolonepropionase